MKRIWAMLLAGLILISICATAYAESVDTAEAIVLFTHDLHSHFLPFNSGDEENVGGCARLMTAIKAEREKHPDAVLVDGGDFSMGTLFQTGFKDSALELRLLGKMGYDATTFGNHEFDYLPEGLASMLNTAASADEPVPQILLANYKPQADTEEGKLLSQALENYKTKDYTIIERGKVCYAIFGIYGEEAHSYAPNSGMTLLPAAETAQATVDKARAECLETYGKEPVVICLSHSGTEDGKGEDVELAKAVEGINLIVSAHSHTKLDEPIKVNNTYIVSASEYGKYLGKASFGVKDGSAQLTEYELIPIDSSIAEDKEIADYIELCKEDVNESYLSSYNLTYDRVLLNNPYEFDTVEDVYIYQHESTLGNLFADSYKWAAERETGLKVDAALTASGVIRESVPLGEVTVADVFESASLGVGTEGELVMVYLTGKDLKTALEVDASVQPIMDTAQLFCSGVEYSFNQNRMIFNKVDYAMLRNDDGSLSEIDDDKLYRVVVGMYIGQMLGTVEESSFGLLKIVPRDEEGNPLSSDEFVNYVIKDEQGVPLKEWYAIASYMLTMNGTMSDSYAKTDGRKIVYKSLNPADMLRGANVFTYVALAVIVLVLFAVILIVVLTVRKIKRRSKNKK
ncbi:MAG: bifunctional metallophosphatase/5'-nucleotidase [Ruminococcus sp.]